MGLGSHLGSKFQEKVKTVILWKSCSHCGNNRILKVQTLPKSIWNTTSNGDGARNRWKSRRAPSWGALFSVRADFWWIFGSNLGPRLGSLGRLSADFRDFLANCGVTCDFSLLEGARGGSEDRFRVSGGASRQGFCEDFGSFSALLWSFVAFYFCSNFVPSLSKFRISCCSTVCVSPLLPCLQLQGRWSRAAC